MNSEPTAVVIGDALIDELRDEAGSREFVGGAALNVAVGLSRLGVQTALVAMVGDDADGDTIRRMLDEHGVQLVANVGEHGTSRAVSDRTDGEPRYLFNEAAQRRSVSFDEEQRTVIASARFVVVSCFPFDDGDQTCALEEAVADPAERLIVDPNPRSGMMHDADAFARNFERVAAQSLLVKVGDEDAELLYGSTLRELRGRLLEGGTRNVLATAGRDGASFAGASVDAAAPIANLDGPVVDTMGAGDAALAATVAEIVERGMPDDDEDALMLLDRAMLVAAATCRAEGALLRLPEPV